MNMNNSKELRIGFVVPSFDNGGLESVVSSIARKIREAGAQITIFVEGGTVGYFADQFPRDTVVPLNGNSEKFFAEIISRKINTLHYNYSTFKLGEAKSLGMAVVYTLHNVYTWHDDSAFQSHAASVRQADKIVAVSTYARDYFAARSGLAAAEITVIPNGVDLARMSNAQPRQPAGLHSVGKRFVFAQFSSFHRVKHHRLIVEAAESLYKKRKDFCVIFFGGVGDEAYYAEIKQAVASSSAREAFFLPGRLDDEAVYAALKSTVDCALLTTLQEGCGNAALEAAALGVPVIMTDTGIARDLRASGLDVDVVPATAPIEGVKPEDIERLSRTGRVGNLDALVDAMERRMKAPDDDRSSSKKERREIIHGFPFSMESMCSSYARLFGDLDKLA